MIKAVIFDLDGTVCYTIDDLRTAMNLMLKEFGMPERSVEEILSAINCGAREFVRRSMPEDKAADPELLEKCFQYYSERYSEHFLDSTYPYEGIPELIGELRSRGIKTALLTNKGDSHARALINKLFGDSFDLVLGNCGRFPTKPDPASALWMASELGAEPREVLYVGDSDVDMKTARNAGFFACGVSWGYRDVPTLCRTGASGIASKPSDILLFL
ncbi:MAG: HAD family hydrolase [Clostridia bacterium]|nr:HAD family hydrolase [Clostridia bacterium]